MKIKNKYRGSGESKHVKQLCRGLCRVLATNFYESAFLAICLNDFPFIHNQLSEKQRALIIFSVCCAGWERFRFGREEKSAPINEKKNECKMNDTTPEREKKTADRQQQRQLTAEQIRTPRSTEPFTRYLYYIWRQKIPQFPLVMLKILLFVYKWTAISHKNFPLT